MSSHQRFRLFYRVFTEMKDTCREHGIRLALKNSVDQMLQIAETSRGDYRYGNSTADRAGQRQIKAITGTVAVHAG